MKQLVQLKSGLSINRLKGEGGSWSPLSIKMNGQQVGWLTTYGDTPVLILSPQTKAVPVTLPERGYRALRLESEE
jgi:hypothetical protein